MKKFFKNNLPWFIVALSLLGFSIILVNLNNNNLAGFDNYIYNIVTINKSDTLTTFYKIMTYFCEPVTIVALYIILFIIVKNKMKFISFGLAGVGTTGLNYVIKKIVKRPRPTDIALIKETGYSFPSNHAMISISFYGFILYLMLKSNLKKWLKVIVTIVMCTLIILISVSRVYLGVHNASDVLAALCLSLAFTITYIKLIYQKRVFK